MIRFVRAGLGLLVLGAAVGGCGGLTREEAATALDESSLSASATALMGSSVEITTSFTIGGAVETAAGEIRAFVESQLPCAEVTLSGATVTIEYGARAGSCTYRGRTYAGTHAITVMANEMDQVVVTHTWTDLHDAQVSVTGSAMVTWSFADQTRHVSHSLTWTRLSDGHTGTGTGDRLQMPLEEGLLTGFTESGERTWTGESGRWTLDIEDVEMRWVDPCPEAGTYTLDTPFRKTITLSFMRTASTNIHVVLTSASRVYDFDVLTVPTL
jgi:hypothetical protein